MDPASSGSKLVRLRDGLLRLKREERDRDQKIRISELLDIIDEADREDARFAEWVEKHAPNWRSDDDDYEIILALLANEDAGVSREEIDALAGNADDDDRRTTASIGRVRTRIWRLGRSLKDSGSTVIIRSGRDGVYRTTDPSIVTLGEVSPPGDR